MWLIGFMLRKACLWKSVRGELAGAARVYSIIDKAQYKQQVSQARITSSRAMVMYCSECIPVVYTKERTPRPNWPEFEVISTRYRIQARLTRHWKTNNNTKLIVL